MMGAAKKLLDKKALRDFIPINALSPAHIEEISKKAVIEQVRSGRYVFKAGDRDNQSVYLLEGKVELVGDGRKVVGTVTAGTDSARHPLAHKQPRQISVRASGAVTVARVDSSLLDVLLTWDQSSGYDVVEIDSAEEGEDWMTRMLQSEAFLRLPPSNIQQLLMRMDAVSARAGDVIVRQGDEGDYFYIVKSGRLAVSRRPSSHGRDVVLAELSGGACFGEEALVSDSKRNATVTMITDGSLMRLAKNDFDELLRTPLVHEIDYPQAQRMIAEGAELLDVRLPGEFVNQSIRGSRNLPLSALRDRLSELDSSRKYILCCDTGRRSASAAFVLGQRGFEVYVLANGLADVPSQDLENPDAPVQDGSPPEAEVIPFGAEPAAGGQDDSGGPAQAELEQARQRIAELERQLHEQGAEQQRLQARMEEVEQEASRRDQARQQEIERLQAAAEAARGQQDGLLEQLRSEKRQLQEALHTEQQRALQASRELERELSSVRDDYQQLGQRASALAGERDAVRAERDELQQKLDALQADRELASGEQAARIEELRARLQEREAALQEQQQGRTELEARLQAHRQQQVELEARLEAQADELVRLEAAHTGLQSQNEALAVERDALRGKLEDAAAANRALADDKQALQAQLESVQGELGALEADQGKALADLEQRLQDGIAERDAAREELQAARQRLAEAAEREQAHAGRLRELEERLDAERRELESDLDTARRALARAQGEQQNVLREQGRLTDALRKAEQRMEQQQLEHDSELHRLRKELEKAGGEADAALVAEVAALESQLGEVRQQAAALESELNGLRAEKEDARGAADTRVTELEQELASLQRQLQQARDSARQAEQQLLEANQAANEEMTVRLEAEEEARRQLQGEVEALRAGQDERGRRVLELEQQLEALQQELAQARSAAGDAQQLAVLEQQLQAGEQAREELEARLQQLEEARDAALGEADAARQEADRLRAEAEVARGLVDMQGAAAEPDPVLRDELEQARKDVELAVRLRSQAEDKAARLQAELERLQQAAAAGAGDAGAGFSDSRLRVPSLDENDPDATALMDAVVADPAGDENWQEDDESQHQAAPARLIDEEGDAAAGRGGKRVLPILVLVAAALAVGGWWYLQQPGRVPPARPGTLVPERDVGPPPAWGRRAPAADGEAGAGQASRPAAPEPAAAAGAPDHAAAAAAPGPVAEEVAPEDTGPEEMAQENTAPEDTAPGPQAEAAGLPRPLGSFSDPLADGGRGPRMVELAADRYDMGSGPTSPRFEERPRHGVSLRRFAIGEREVTFADYDRFARATGRALPDDSGWGRGRRPVINVSWEDAVAYTRWLSGQTGRHYRLPSEAEWEYAARAGTRSRFWWGDEAADIPANCFDCGSEWDASRTAPVASFAANGLGLYDTAGNVMEWVQDCYVGSYQSAPDDGSAVLAGPCATRVVRGGGYSSPSEQLRSASRAERDPASRLDNLGFRVARDL